MPDIAPSTSQPALEFYERRKTSVQETLSQIDTRCRKLIGYRIATSIPGLLLLVAGFAEPRLGDWTWQLGLVFLCLFLVFATIYENLQWKLQKHRSELFGIQRLINRCHRNWKQLNALPNERSTQSYESDWTKDLDIFGDRSLFRWMSLAMTQSGSENVACHLTRWATPEAIAERQEAVQALAPARDWRIEFYQIACGLRNQHSHPEAIAEWVQSPNHFADKPLLRRTSILGPILAIGGSLLLAASLAIPWPAGQLLGTVVTLAGFSLNFLISMFAIGPIHDLFNRIGHANRELQQLNYWIAKVDTAPRSAKLLAKIHETLLGKEADQSDATSTGGPPAGANQASPQNAIAGIRQLQQIMARAGLQKSPVFFLPYTLLQVSLLWDVRVLSKLEKWKEHHASSVPGWFAALGELEGLLSAATLADEHPDWSFPLIQSQGAILQTEEMAHPLLKDTARVANDFQVTDEQRLVLVTGSNMAGKSTLLRTVGVNAALARLGAPVCAKRWCSESFDIASSIRVQDSLQDGVSFFMAELKRLRKVVDQAAAEARPDGHRMLVLLDEILQGTNSRERQIAVDSVLRRLVELGCIVLASTHDLELASSDQMKSFAQIVHFREYFESVDGKQIMRFDYKMRPGVTPTTNALKLLEMVGL